jgi:hypothetical protein
MAIRWPVGPRAVVRTIFAAILMLSAVRFEHVAECACRPVCARVLSLVAQIVPILRETIYKRTDTRRQLRYHVPSPLCLR